MWRGKVDPVNEEALLASYLGLGQLSLICFLSARRLARSRRERFLFALPDFVGHLLSVDLRLY